MPITFKEEDGHYKMECIPPLPGIDTSAPAPYISGLADADNFIISDGTYNTASWQPVSFGDQSTYHATDNLLGFGELAFPVTAGGGVQNIGDKFFYVTQDTSSNFKGFASDNVQTPSTAIGTVLSASGIVNAPISWKTVNNTTYFSAAQATQILQIATDATGTTTMTELTNVLGAQFIGEFNGRLIALNVWQLVGSGSAVLTNFPYQMAWSAGGQQYNVWNALDGSGNPTGAGFNNLPDVEDAITGALFIGPTIYVIRRKGITEVTALNSGIQPFNFDHMWASHNGVGTVYPDTIAQYGPKGCFVADDDIYTIGLAGISTIGGKAKAGIYSDLMNSNFNVQGAMVPLMVNGEPALYYVLAMQLNSNTQPTNNFIRAWFCDLSTGEWMKLTLPNGTVSQGTQTLIDVMALLISNIIITSTPDNVSFSGLLMGLQKPSAVPTWWYVPLDPFNNTAIGSPGQSKLVFPNIRVQTLKDITVDAVLTYAFGNSGDTIAATVDTVPYTNQVMGTGRDSAKNLYTSYPQNQVAQTGLQPQLVIQAQGNLQLAEVSAYCSVGQGRRP